jgi:hypothetical protein
MDTKLGHLKQKEGQQLITYVRQTRCSLRYAIDALTKK